MTLRRFTLTWSSLALVVASLFFVQRQPAAKPAPVVLPPAPAKPLPPAEESAAPRAKEPAARGVIIAPSKRVASQQAPP